MSTRDNQRKRLYDGERAWDGWKVPVGKGTVPECQKFVDDITRSSWWRNRGGRSSIRVTDGRGARMATSRGGTINIPRWARTRGVIMHELAHEFTPNNVAPHGPEYAANYVALVRKVEGAEVAADLKRALREHRVKIRGGNPVKKQPKLSLRCFGCSAYFPEHRVWWHVQTVSGSRFHTRACAEAWFQRRLTKKERT